MWSGREFCQQLLMSIVLKGARATSKNLKFVIDNSFWGLNFFQPEQLIRLPVDPLNREKSLLLCKTLKKCMEVFVLRCNRRLVLPSFHLVLIAKYACHEILAIKHGPIDE